MHGLLNRLALWRALASRLRGLFAPRPAQPAPCGMGLDGLPQGLGRLPLGTPVALAWQSHSPEPLWAQALLHDLLQHGPVFLLADSEHPVDPLLLHPALAQAYAQGQLRVWLMGAGARPGAQPYGTEALLRELEQAGLTPAHALLALASPQAHLGSSVAQVLQAGRQMRRWCQGRRRPTVFAFHGWDNADQVLGPLRSLPTVFEHVALLGSQDAQPMLFIQRWNGSDGPVFEARLGLRPDPATQRLVYDGSQMRGPAQRLVEAPDHYQVIATQGAVAAQRSVPAAWTVVPSLADVVAATHSAVAATVLLHTGPTAQQEDLRRLVYQLRAQHGRTLKIVVLETQDKLRSNQEQALLSLGANTVVYREVGFARLQRLLADMRDETFARALPPDYERARAGFMPDAVRGYLPTLAFCESVEAMLARTSAMGLQHSFLRLSMQPHVAHLDAVQACRALRDGDVLSADQNALYVFMFACAETDIDPALGRLFSIPPSELFAAQTVYGSVDGMRSALRELREAARLGVPDYSSHSAAHPSATPSPARTDPHPGTDADADADAASATALPHPGLHLQAPPTQHSTPLAVPTPTVQARALARRAAPYAEGTSDVA